MAFARQAEATMVHDYEGSVWRRIVSIFDHSFIDWSLSSSLSVKRKSFYLALKKKSKYHS
jgi:hypothetical protein